MTQTAICPNHESHYHSPRCTWICPLYDEFCAHVVHFLGSQNVRPGEAADAAEFLEHFLNGEVYERMHGILEPDAEYSEPLTDARSFATELLGRFGVMDVEGEQCETCNLAQYETPTPVVPRLADQDTCQCA